MLMQSGPDLAREIGAFLMLSYAARLGGNWWRY